MAAPNYFVTNPGGAKAPNFAAQVAPPQKPRDEAYVKKHAVGGSVFPELNGSPQVGTGIGLPRKK